MESRVLGVFVVVTNPRKKRLLLFCCKVTDQAITHVINFPQKWSKSMFIVIVVQNLIQKEQQSTIFVKVAMVTTFTWKSEVSQCKSVEFMLSTLLLYRSIKKIFLQILY